jgi:hypothetical protein
MDKSDCRISFNSLKKFVTSLLVAIGALGSPLEPHPESNLTTSLYSGSTQIAIMDEFDHRVDFNRLKKFVISLSAVIGVSGSRLGPRLERDLTTNLYSGSTSIAIKTSPITGSDLHDYKKSTTSLEEVIKA